MPRTPKPTAKRWPQAKTPATAWRDRGTAHLADGSSQGVVAYGATAREASEKLNAKIDALEAQHPQADTITVTELFAEFVQHKRSVKGNKAKTIHDDLGMFSRHVQPAIGATPLARLTLTDLQRIQHALTSEGKWRSAERCTILLKAMLTFAAKRYRAEVASGYLHLVLRDDLDNIKRPPGSKRKVNPLWTLDQVKAFLTLAEAQYDAHPRNIMYPLFYTALEAALRRGELLGMRREALKSVTVRGRSQHYLEITEQLIDYAGSLHHDTPKTPHSVRRVPITDRLAEVLRRHMVRMDRAAERDGYSQNKLMFPSWSGTPLTPRNLYRSRDALIETLDLPASTLHEMRKASNTHFTAALMRQGNYSPKVVSRRLGHASDRVALDVYTLLNQDDYMSATLSLDVDMQLDMEPGVAPNEEDAEF